jgi:hypothetical protein
MRTAALRTLVHESGSVILNVIGQWKLASFAAPHGDTSKDALPPMCWVLKTAHAHARPRGTSKLGDFTGIHIAFEKN